MKASDYVLSRLAAEGIDTAFVLYGGAISELMDAFTRQDRIKYVCAQHEQAAGFMAEGYAKVKGVPGLAIATSGPGGQNLVTAIANCFYDSVPCIFITGQVATNLMRKNTELRQFGFQECPIVDIVRPITKYAITIPKITVVKLSDAINTIMEVAIGSCKEGRPGPVLIDIPTDIQREEYSSSI